MSYNCGRVFILSVFVGYILSFGLVRLKTIRLSARASAHIECSSRSRVEDETITNVIIKTQDRKMGLGCYWRYAQKRWAGILGDFEKKKLVEICLWAKLVEIRLWVRSLEIRTWARPVQLFSTGCTAHLLGQLVEILTVGREFSCGVDCGRCMNSQHSKNCVSLSSCRKTKLKKSINVLYLN